MEAERKKRRSTQTSSLAGEFFVAGELAKREFQVSVTLGPAKSLDLFAFSERLGYTFAVQVKTLRDPNNNFPLAVTDVHPDVIYVFVILHKVGDSVEYAILTGQEVIDHESELFGGGSGRGENPGILANRVCKYRDRWNLFESRPVHGTIGDAQPDN
jgi:hypothetical protein